MSKFVMILFISKILTKTLSSTLIYFSTFLISLFFCMLYEKKEKSLNKNQKIILLVLTALPLILLATFRYNVGVDYLPNIENAADIVEHFSLKFIFEFYTKTPLYVIFTYLGFFLFKSFSGTVYLYSIIFLFFIIKGIIYYKDKISISLALIVFCLGYYLMFFNITRQMISVSIVFFASKYLFEKKFWKYLFWVTIAGLFHLIAFAMIFAYLLNIKLNSSKIIKIYYIFILLTPIWAYTLIKFILLIINTLGIFKAYSNIEFCFNFRLFLYLIPEFIIVFTARKKVLKLDTQNELFYRLVVLQFPIQFMGLFVRCIDRMSLFLGIFEIILIPLVLKAENKKLKYAIIFSYYIIFFCIKYAIGNSNGVYPYTSLF